MMTKKLPEDLDKKIKALGHVSEALRSLKGLDKPSDTIPDNRTILLRILEAEKSLEKAKKLL